MYNMRTIKKIYHQVFIASSLSFLVSMGLASLVKLFKILLLRDVKITDVMALGLSGLVKDKDIELHFSRKSIVTSSASIINISVANYMNRASSSINSSKTVVLNFQGIRMSSVPSPGDRSRLYANLMLKIASEINYVNFLLLEHKVIDGFAGVTNATFESLLSTSAARILYRPSIKFLFSKNLECIQQAAKNASYYLGSYGTDATIFLMEGTPCAIFNCGYYAMRKEFEQSKFDRDSLAYAKFLKVHSRISADSFNSHDVLNSQSEIALNMPLVIAHMQHFLL